jgi:hypothetical protein
VALLSKPKTERSSPATVHIPTVQAHSSMRIMLDRSFGPVAQPRPLQPHLPVGELNAPRLRTVMPDFAAGFTRVRGPVTCSALNVRISSSVFTPISWMTLSMTWLALWIMLRAGSGCCFRELLDDGRRLLGGSRDDLIGFTQGGWSLRIQGFRKPDSIEAGRRLPPTFN